MPTSSSVSPAHQSRIEWKTLWCLFDRITPGYLRDLKWFSANYAEDKPDNLRELKSKLDQPFKGVRRS